MPPLFGSEIKTGQEILDFLCEIAENKDLHGISCFGKSDGGGAQAIATMSVQLFCELTGQTYYHTPFRRIRFSDGRDDWDAQWESFFNLGLGEATPPDDIPVLGVRDYLKQGRPKGVILGLPYAHNYIQNIHTPEKYEILRAGFREKYWSSGKDGLDSLIEHKDYMALHVRRGDVTAEANTGRYVSDEDVVDSVTKFREKIGFDGEMHVFSQGEESDFDYLKQIGDVKFFLNADIFETVHRIVNAKAIVGTKSSLSYIAGLLSDAPFFTEMWYHQPLGSWYRMTDKGSVHTQDFLASLKTQEAELLELLRERSDQADDKIIQTVRENDELLAVSSKAHWIYAQALLRQEDEDAYPTLMELSQLDVPQANSAKKTLDSHAKMGLFTWP